MRSLWHWMLPLLLILLAGGSIFVVRHHRRAPVLPASVSRQMTAPGAILASAEQRGGKVIHVTVQALCESTLCVLNPFDPITYSTGSTVPVCVDDGTDIVLQTNASYREALQWQAKARVVYRLSVNTKETS